MAAASAEVRVFERTALVSDSEIDAFRADGVVHLRGVLTRREVNLLRRAVDDQFQNRLGSTSGYDFQALAEQYWKGACALDAGAATRFDMQKLLAAVDADPEARPLFDDSQDPRADGVFFYEAAGWRRYAEIREAAFDSNLPEICARLTGSAYVNFWEDTTFIKTPGATLRTPFHQDYTYFQIDGRKCCVVWIPLDPADSENGAMEYVIGSHLWGKEFSPSVFISQTPVPGAVNERLDDIEANRSRYDIRCVAADPGDVIIHDVMTVHGSSGNRSSGRTRRGVSFRYCGDDIRYRSKPGALAQPWVSDPPGEGERLYSRYYPRVWPRPFPGAKLSLLYPDGV